MSLQALMYGTCMSPRIMKCFCLKLTYEIGRCRFCSIYLLKSEIEFNSDFSPKILDSVYKLYLSKFCYRSPIKNYKIKILLVQLKIICIPMISCYPDDEYLRFS